MRQHRVWLLGCAMVALVGVAGCQGGGPHRSLASNEPALDLGSGGTAVADSPAKTNSWVDRHPLFSKPREYYANTNTRPAGKVAAATVVGIPAGILGEMKQIVVGRPPVAQLQPQLGVAGPGLGDAPKGF